jgi:hypothetical protein
MNDALAKLLEAARDYRQPPPFKGSIWSPENQAFHENARRALLKAASDPALDEDMREIDEMLRVIRDHERATPGIKALVAVIRAALGVGA